MDIETKRHLAKKGITPHRCQVVSDPTSTLFAVAYQGKIQQSSTEWSTFCDYETTLSNIAQASFSSACSWVRNQVAGATSDRDLSDKRILMLGYSLVPVSIEAVQ